MSEDDGMTTGQAIHCTACGARNHPGASFCSACGSKMVAAAAPAPAAVTPPLAAVPLEPTPPPPASPPSAPPPPAAAAAVATGAVASEAALDSVADGSAPPHRTPPPASGGGGGNAGLVIGAIVVLLVVVICLCMFGPWGNVFAPSVKLFANRDVPVTGATDAGANTVGELKRGDSIAGKWVRGPNGRGRWLRVNWSGAGKGFIWGPDLSAKARPEVTLAPDSPKAQTASVVYAEPDAHAPVIDDLSRGETATSVGATGDGWTEIALNAGGVGYVKTSALQSAGAQDANADAPPAQIAALNAITHYSCSFAPEMSKNAPEDTAALSFYFDESRRCLNHRYAYISDEAGGAKRVMLDDKDRRAVLLYFMPDRRSFYRTDLTLAPDDYAKLAHKGGAMLGATICALPGDTAEATKLQASLKRASPDLDTQKTSGSWQRRVWRCTPDASDAQRSAGGD